MKRILATVMALSMSIAMTTTAWAGTWKQDSTGWWYQNDDGSYQNNGWFKDTDGKWYYFNQAGYILTNTTTPDGCSVDASGAWVTTGASTAASSTGYTFSGDHAELKKQIIDEVNAQRVANGLAALTVDEQLMTFAQKRADMMLTDFSHDKWLDGYPYDATNKTEDIAMMSESSGADAIVNMWMQDPPHRADVLNPASKTGVGVIVSGGYAYVVRVANTPK